MVKSARGAVPVFRPVRFPGAASRTGHATCHRTRLSTSLKGFAVVVLIYTETSPETNAPNICRANHIAQPVDLDTPAVSLA